MRTTGGLGLGGIILIVGLLYYTNAGNWLLTGLGRLGQNCSSMVPDFASSVGYPVCAGVAKGTEFIINISSDIGDFIRDMEQRVSSVFGSGPKFESISDLNFSLRNVAADLASSKDKLNEMIQNGPQQLIGGNTAQQFQQAIDNFTIGQFYLKRGGINDALPWLQQSARQPAGFGVMSQLSLGDIYSQGGSGIAANPRQAQAYYQAASDSLNQLSSSNSPQAQQMLQSLPASPQQIQLQIRQAITQLQRH